MADKSITVPAPQGALGWTPRHGWIYDRDQAQQAVDDRALTLVVVGGSVHVDARQLALRALLRIDIDVDQLIERVDELADSIEGVATGEALDLAAVKRRLDALERNGCDNARRPCNCRR